MRSRLAFRKLIRAASDLIVLRSSSIWAFRRGLVETAAVACIGIIFTACVLVSVDPDMARAQTNWRQGILSLEHVIKVHHDHHHRRPGHHDWSGPSFNCRGATSQSAQAVCNNPNLSHLDLVMAALYKQLIETQPNQQASLHESQHAWLQRREQTCGRNVGCLQQVYQARIEELRLREQPTQQTAATPQQAQASDVSTMNGIYLDQSDYTHTLLITPVHEVGLGGLALMVSLKDVTFAATRVRAPNGSFMYRHNGCTFLLQQGVAKNTLVVLSGGNCVGIDAPLSNIKSIYLTAASFGQQLVGPGAAKGPSFNCRQASASSDKAVCANRQLSYLDRTVAKLYSETLALPQAQNIRIAEHQWISQRNQCGANVECLQRLYERRIDELKGAAVMAQLNLMPALAKAYNQMQRESQASAGSGTQPYASLTTGAGSPPTPTAPSNLPLASSSTETAKATVAAPPPIVAPATSSRPRPSAADSGIQAATSQSMISSATPSAPGTAAAVAPVAQAQQSGTASLPDAVTASLQELKANPSFETSPEPSYRPLMLLYMAANADILDNQAFAWRYFTTFDVPPDTASGMSSKECSSLNDELKNEFARAQVLSRASASLKPVLRAANAWPKHAVFKMAWRVSLGPYDTTQQVFRYSQYELQSNTVFGGKLEIARRPNFPTNYIATPAPLPCGVASPFSPGNQTSGLETVPGGPIDRFVLDIGRRPELQTLPMPAERAQAYLQSSMGPQNRGNRPSVTIEVLVDVGPATLNAKNVPGLIPSQIIAARAIDAATGKILYTYKLPPPASAVAQTVPAPSGTAKPLTNLRLALLLLQDHPELVSDDGWIKMAAQQIKAEQSCFAAIDKTLGNQNYANYLRLDPKKPAFLFEWQKAEKERPDLANGPLLDVFRSPGADWSFVSKEQGYDPRFAHIVDAFVFGKDELHGRQPDFAAHDLFPVFKRLTLAAAAKAPTYFEVTDQLPAVGYDFKSKAFRFKSGTQGVFSDKTQMLPVAEDSDLKGAAGQAFLYQARGETAPPAKSNSPGVNLQCTHPTQSWRSIISNFVTINSDALARPVLAFDKELVLRQIPVSESTAETLTRKLDFEGKGLTARISFQIENTAVQPAKGASGTPWLVYHAKFVGATITAPDGTMVARLTPSDFLTSAEQTAAVAKSEAAALGTVKTSLSEPVMLGPEVADLLIVKHRPTLPKNFFWNMMLARRDYERTSKDPQYGRFFTSALSAPPQPDLAQLRPLLPKFEKWTRDRAAALPDKVTVDEIFHLVNGALTNSNCLWWVNRAAPVQVAREYTLNIRQCGAGAALGLSGRNARADDIRIEGTIPTPDANAAWLRALPGDAVRRDLDLNVTGVDPMGAGSFRFDTTVVDARFIDAQSGKLLATLTPPAPKPEAKATLPATGGPDILGIQIGMTFAKAEKIIRDHMDVGTTLVADRKWSAGAASGSIEPFTSGKLFISRDDKEAIILYDEPPAAAGIVMGVTRQLRLPKRKVLPAALFANLQKKYGQEALIAKWLGLHIWSDRGALFYSGTTELRKNCVGASLHTNSNIWRFPDGKPVTPSIDYSNLPSFETMFNFVSMSATCKRGVAAMFETAAILKSDVFDTWLFDMGAYDKAFQASKKMPQKPQVSSDTSTQKLGIKF